MILTMHEEEAFFFEALRAGAAGYVLKGASSEELLGAIRAVYEGGVYRLLINLLLATSVACSLNS